MATDLVSRVKVDPNFIELERKRGAFSWTVSIIMMAIYFTFIVMVAFFKDVLSIEVYGVITLAFPFGLVVLFSAFTLVGIYVTRANGEFDTLTRKIVETVR